jgi:SAM-dependent methyltransferase
VVDHQFADASLAALYDVFCPWDPRGDSGFYMPLVMAADSVLDVGCGTGMLLRRARAEGHAGRLCGLDPAAAMLDVARASGDIEWVLGDLSGARWDQEFDLVVMTGHAFQVLIGDEQLRVALAAVRAALAPAGLFAFETRNPLVRQWEEWVPANAVQVTDPAGPVVRMTHQVELPVQGDLVSFTTTYSSPGWEQPRDSRSTLRFLDAGTLSSFLAGAGLVIEVQYGDWDGALLSPASPEIITVARRRQELRPVAE